MINYNLIWQNRFTTGTLSDWTLDQTGGTISLVTKDYSKKMQLADSLATARTLIELVDSSGDAVLTADLGNVSGEIQYHANADAEISSASYPVGIYKQVVFIVGDDGLAALNISEPNNTYGSMQKVGERKEFTGTITGVKISKGTLSAYRAISATREFIVELDAQYTAAASWIDEVKVYYPDIFLLGDSRMDGKLLWSTHPAYPHRLLSTQDETSPPNYALMGLIGSGVYVANRANGGANLVTVDDQIQRAALGHFARRIIISVGHNDIYPDVRVLADLQASIQSIIGQISAAGISPAQVILNNVTGSFYIATQQARDLMDAWNAWLPTYCTSIGAVHVDQHAVLKDPLDAYDLNPTYAYTDGAHLNKVGSLAMMTPNYAALPELPTEEYGAAAFRVKTASGYRTCRIWEKTASKYEQRNINVLKEAV